MVETDDASCAGWSDELDIDSGWRMTDAAHDDSVGIGHAGSIASGRSAAVPADATAASFRASEESEGETNAAPFHPTRMAVSSQLLVARSEEHGTIEQETESVVESTGWMM
jgi:hypothetical protein